LSKCILLKLKSKAGRKKRSAGGSFVKNGFSSLLIQKWSKFSGNPAINPEYFGKIVSA
jgi:hypothetical protein